MANAKNAKIIQSDNYSDIYYLIDGENGGYYKVMRINLSDPNSLTTQTVTPSVDLVTDFVVYKDGNLVYGYVGGNRRLIKANGSLYNLTGRYYWRAPDGYIYYNDLSDMGTIQQVSVDLVTYDVTLPVYGSIQNTINMFNGYQNLVEMQNRLILASISYGVLFELYNPTDDPRRITAIDMTSIKNVGTSTSYYYLAGNNDSAQPVLNKVDPTADNYTNLLTPGDYDIYKMTVSSTDEIIFNALRMSDGAIIIGKIDALGSLEIIDETLNEELIVLERIN